MRWLDPDSVPTLGDWFRAGGYETHYRGKWHVSHADLVIPGTHDALMASDNDGNVIPEAVEAYRKADRLDPFGFSGWIGREPHGASRADCGAVRDGVFAEQVVELFAELAKARRDGPWLTVASFVNPHDIAFAGGLWEQLLKFAPPDDTVPEIPEAPSQSDSFAGRPPCQEQFKAVWPQMIVEQPTDLAYRRLYYYLQKLVDKAIGRILDALDDVGSRRRHHRRVHVGPRRSPRCPRRTDAEVVQRVRRGDPRAAPRQGPGSRDTLRRDHHAHESRRPDPHPDGTGGDRRRARHGRSRRTPRRGATTTGARPERAHHRCRRTPSRSRRRCTS